MSGIRGRRARLGLREEPSAAQRAALGRWQRRFNLPILLAALIPLFVTSPSRGVVAIVVGLGSWLVFVVDLLVRRRIVPDYLHTRGGRADLVIVILTFPYYLLPNVSNFAAVLLLARLARVARVLIATAGIRRFAQRLGKVALVAGIVVVVCSLSAYKAEHPTNPGFATVGDALWWGIVTLTTVGYGDIVPKTFGGRLSGVAIMFTGIAVLGVLAGSLASLFGLGVPATDEPDAEAAAGGNEMGPLHEELAELRAQLQRVEERLGRVAEVARLRG